MDFFSLSKLQLVWVNKWNGKILILKTATGLITPSNFFRLDCVIITNKKRSKTNVMQLIDLILLHSLLNNLSFFFSCPVVYQSRRLAPQFPGSLVPSAAPRLLPVTGRCHCPAPLPACCHIDGAEKQRGWQTGWLTSPQMGPLKIQLNLRESCISNINISVYLPPNKLHLRAGFSLVYTFVWRFEVSLIKKNVHNNDFILSILFTM